MGILDTSVINIDNGPKYTQQDVVNEMMPKLREILRHSFPGNPERQKIKTGRDRLTFCAPCCGDSANNPRKKRGNLTISGKYANMYKCYNCGMFMSASKFFDTYGDPLSMKAIDYFNENSFDYASGNLADASINLLYDMDAIESVSINREVLKRRLNLVECKDDQTSLRYLSGRKQYSFDRFLYNASHGILFILNLTPSGNIIGMQTRHLNENYTGPKYKTYNIRRIYTDIFRVTPPEISDWIESLSMIFNIFIIDYRIPVTVLEGPMDSFLVKNSIALCGAGKHADFVFKCRYIFDDDKTGREHAIEKLSEGNEVFLWTKFKEDIGAPKRKKWDINDIYKWAASENVKVPRLDQYFSNDKLDLLYI